MGGDPVGDAWGAITGQNAAKDARRDQGQAADRAMQLQYDMYQQQRQDMEPWRQAGITALGGLQDPNFGKDLTMDPGWQMRIQEGRKALEGSLASRGATNSGAAMKAITNYGQEAASAEYDKAYNRQYQRLSNLAGIGNDASRSNANAAGNYGQSASDIQIGLGNANAASRIGTWNTTMGLLGQGAQAGGMAAAGGAVFSDERLKTDIEEISREEIQEMKAHLKAYKFTYKNKDHGAGDWIGVMAQDLEKSKLGKTFVFDDENGNKQLHIPRLLSFFLATMAEG